MNHENPQVVEKFDYWPVDIRSFDLAPYLSDALKSMELVFSTSPESLTGDDRHGHGICVGMWDKDTGDTYLIDTIDNLLLGDLEESLEYHGLEETIDYGWDDVADQLTAIAEKIRARMAAERAKDGKENGGDV